MAVEANPYTRHGLPRFVNSPLMILSAADRAGLSAVKDNHLAEMALVVLLEPAGLTLAALLAE